MFKLLFCCHTGNEIFTYYVHIFSSLDIIIRILSSWCFTLLFIHFWIVCALLFFSSNSWEKQPPEVFYKKMLLKSLQNWQENTCAQSSLSIELKTSNLIKKETLTWVFSFDFHEIFENAFFKEHFWVPALSFLLITYIFFSSSLFVLTILQ